MCNICLLGRCVSSHLQWDEQKTSLLELWFHLLYCLHVAANSYIYAHVARAGWASDFTSRKSVEQHFWTSRFIGACSWAAPQHFWTSNKQQCHVKSRLIGAIATEPHWYRAEASQRWRKCVPAIADCAWRFMCVWSGCMHSSTHSELYCV